MGIEQFQRDAHGFVVTSPGTSDFKQLFATQATLIVAPPWLGKTTVARALGEYLKRNSGKLDSGLDFGEMFHLTLIEEFIAGSQIGPPWWKTWRSNSGDLACWIIDGLDEALSHQGLLPYLLGQFRDLTRQECARLRLILFGRGAELPQGFFDELEKFYGDDLRVLELLPLDRDNAECMIGAERLGKTLATINRCSLQNIAGIPAALDFLKKQEVGVELSDLDVWKGVLSKLLAEPNGLRGQRQGTELEERFKAAAHLATALTFSGLEEIRRDTEGALSAADGRESVALLDLIPRDFSVDRNAARDALRSGMFTLTPSGYRFAHRNVREWMCAFGARDLRLGQLKPLLRYDLSRDSPIPRLFLDLTKLLRKTAKEKIKGWLEEVVDPLPSDAAPPNLGEAVAILGQLEELAARGKWTGGFESTRKFARLATPGVGVELAGRLADRNRAIEARLLVAGIAQAIEAHEPAEAAARIVGDPAESWKLRLSCASYLRAVPDKEALKRLISVVEAMTPESRDETEMVSMLVSAFLRVGLWGATQAYGYLSEEETDRFIVGAASLLPAEVAEKMTFDDAVAIFESIPDGELERLARHHGGSPRRSPRREALSAAAQTIASHRPVQERALRLLTPWALPSYGNELSPKLASGFQESREARRALFMRGVDRTRNKLFVHSYWLWHSITVEDLLWLERKLPGLAEGAESFVWRAFLSLAHREEAGQDDQERCRKLVAQHAPESLAHFDSERRLLQEQESKDQEKADEKKRQERRLEELNRELLDAGEPLERKLWALSRINLAEEVYRPQNVVGDWSDLPGNLREEILALCHNALDEMEPTPTPSGRSYLGGVYFEAIAFLTLLRQRSEFDLTGERIKKWLPAALVSLGSSEQTELLLACAAVAPQVTEDVVLEAIERELGQDGHYSVVLQDLPEELWTNRVSEWVASKLEDDAIHLTTRAKMVDFLGARAPNKGLAFARRTMEGGSIESILGFREGLAILRSEENIGSRALNLLLALDPEAAWPRVQEAFELVGTEVLSLLPSLYGGSQARLSVDVESWPSGRLVELEVFLLQAFPPEEDPDLTGKAFSITPGHQLRRLRNVLFEHLDSRPDSVARDGIERLSAEYPALGDWRNWRSSEHQAQNLLEDLAERSQEEMEIPPVDAVVRALLDTDYRLIRHGRDLLDVVVEELERINEDVGEDLVMLYLPRETQGHEKNRHEEAFQAYVYRRLKDRLPGKVLDRECQVKYRWRKDIGVRSRVAGTEDFAEVTIEVKWSSNGKKRGGISTGLEDQLGEKYLLGRGEAYGIFLVGWNGKLGAWYHGTIERPVKKELPASLIHALKVQAERFQEQHAKVEIRPVVLDMAWPAEE